ncbi:MAG: hypothetical protein HY291_19085 [Planctomycetes bacterium]|nr:hypothetical protein [Planctomycetota bacterium]
MRMPRPAATFPGMLLLILAGGARGAEPPAAAPASVAERAEVSQYGITWMFDKPVKSGQFITGDWWVVGPVTVTGVTPAAGPAPADATTDAKKNRWGDTSLKNDNRMRNGSMVVLKAGDAHGYDSRSATFDPALSISYPYTLETNRSLISTISHNSLPADNFCQNIMWSKEKKSQCVLRAAEVLTCLAEPPPEDAFRPCYAGTEKTLWRAKDLKWDLLLKLKPEGSVPAWDEFERYFQRPWLDHLTNWTQQEVNPTENQPNYGREHARLVSMASLMLLLDVPQEQKKKLAIGLVQYGIDIAGVARVGGNWNWGGGHTSGRKWPVVFASLMLDDSKLRDVPESAVFHEDAQTYYGKGWFGQTVLWQMIVHHGPRAPYEEKPPEQWEEWDKTSEAYRVCCNAKAWVGTALAAREMKAIQAWEHDAFFDYCDRWMREDDPYKEKRGAHPRPPDETTTYDPFVDAMWKTYRKTAPEQDWSGKNRKWITGKVGKWEPNERIAQ